jgi:isoleucyl-tRNA synthetase
LIDELTNGYIRPIVIGSGQGTSRPTKSPHSTPYNRRRTHDGDGAVHAVPGHIFTSRVLTARRSKTGSVHLCHPIRRRIQPPRGSAVAQQVILLGRQRREEVRVNLRKPLRCLTIVHRDAALLDELRTLEPFVKRELNVKEVRYDQAEENYIRLSAKPNFQLLCKRLGKQMKRFQARIEQLTREQIDALQESGAIAIDGEEFSDAEIIVARGKRRHQRRRIGSFDRPDCGRRHLIAEGVAREAVNRIQRSRKEMNLNVADRIHVVYGGAPAVVDAITRHADYVAGETLATQLHAGEPGAGAISTMICDLALVYRIELATGAAGHKRPLVCPKCADRAARSLFFSLSRPLISSESPESQSSASPANQQQPTSSIPAD